MPDAPDFLEKFTAGLGPTEYTFDLDRRRFLSFLVEARLAKSEEDASILFEQNELALASIVYTTRWAVQYNVYTDRVHFDRLPPGEYIARVVELHNLSLGIRLTQHLRRLSPRQFELFLRCLLDALPGYSDVRVSAPGPDGGMDLSARRQTPEMAGPVLVVGQAKHWSKPAGAPVVRQLMGLMLQHSKTRLVEGIFISLSGFTLPARETPGKCPLPLRLWSTSDIVDLSIQHEVGTRRTQLDLVTPNPAFWTELNDL
ncbi:MAG: restriction endonuclease [Nitrososphaerales archaeon]